MLHVSCLWCSMWGACLPVAFHTPTLVGDDVIRAARAGLSCGAGYCVEAARSSSVSTAAVSSTRLYVLVSVFLACAALAALLLFLCLDPLEGEMQSRQGALPDQLLACFRFFLDRRVVCLLPLMFYSLLQVSFMFGEFSKVSQTARYVLVCELRHATSYFC